MMTEEVCMLLDLWIQGIGVAELDGLAVLRFPGAPPAILNAN